MFYVGRIACPILLVMFFNSGHFRKTLRNREDQEIREYEKESGNGPICDVYVCLRMCWRKEENRKRKRYTFWSWGSNTREIWPRIYHEQNRERREWKQHCQLQRSYNIIDMYVYKELYRDIYVFLNRPVYHVTNPGARKTKRNPKGWVT